MPKIGQGQDLPFAVSKGTDVTCWLRCITGRPPQGAAPPQSRKERGGMYRKVGGACRASGLCESWTHRY